jgi:hypothetical protein
LRNAQRAPRPSCCAATFESAAADFHKLGSWMKGRNAGSYSSGVFSNSCAASSYACFRTFQTYMCVQCMRPGDVATKSRTLCTQRSTSGRELKSSSSAILGLCLYLRTAERNFAGEASGEGSCCLRLGCLVVSGHRRLRPKQTVLLISLCSQQGRLRPFISASGRAGKRDTG